MRIIIDCNVLVAAGIKNGTCRAVLKQALNHHTIYLSEAIMMEYLQVIRRGKFKDYYKTLENLVILLSDAAIILQGITVPYCLPDPKDIIYLEAASAANADYLITGNIKDFPEAQYDSIKIITPTQFQASFLSTN